MHSVKYRPGARAPRTGAYTVTHRTHRLSHIVLVDEGTMFPPCRKCGQDVRFELYMRIQRMEADRDFAREEEQQERKPEKNRKDEKVLPFRNPLVS
jgi:hypothetical protein